MTQPDPSPRRFRLIQIGTALGLTAVVGLAYALMWNAWGGDALAAVVVGGALSALGIYTATMAAPRIHDPSRTVTLDRYETSTQMHRDLTGPEPHRERRVEVQRHVGQEVATYTRPLAIKLTVRGIALALFGLGLAWVIHSYL